MNKDLVFLGIQWCGKGTQAKLLLETLPNHLYYEMGQTFRALMSNSNLIGDYVRNLVDNGIMVDDFITFELIDTSLQICHNSKKALLIDGFPRIDDQGQWFAKKMAAMDRDYVIVHFELSKEKALERMMKRAAIEWRKDDTPQVMEQRIATFMNNTLPVIKHFEALGKVIVVNADDSIENIQADLRAKLGL